MNHWCCCITFLSVCNKTDLLERTCDCYPQKQLAEEKAAVEKEMRQRLEDGLREREELLQSQMREQLERLAEEKQQVEERLQQEMEKAVQEKDRELQDRLEGEKDRLQKVVWNFLW